MLTSFFILFPNLFNNELIMLKREQNQIEGWSHIMNALNVTNGNWYVMCISPPEKSLQNEMSEGKKNCMFKIPKLRGKLGEMMKGKNLEAKKLGGITATTHTAPQPAARLPGKCPAQRLPPLPHPSFPEENPSPSPGLAALLAETG